MILPNKLWKKVDRKRIGRKQWESSKFDKLIAGNYYTERQIRKVRLLVDELYETVMIETPFPTTKTYLCAKNCKNIKAVPTNTTEGINKCILCLETDIDECVARFEKLIIAILSSNNKYEAHDAVSDMNTKYYMMLSKFNDYKMYLTISLVAKIIDKINLLVNTKDIKSIALNRWLR